MNVYDSFGYSGGALTLWQNDSVIFLSGNSICKWNIDSQKKEYIHSSKNGFQCFAVSCRRKMIVAAEYSINPVVHVYRDEEEFDLNGVSPLEILQMDISDCGQYLLVVVGVPKYEIIIWDLKSRTKIKGSGAQLPLKLSFKEARFMILGTSFYVKYEKILQVFALQPSFENENGSIVKNFKISLTAYIDLTTETDIIQDYNLLIDSRSTEEQNNLYLIQGNTLIYLNQQLQEITRWQAPEPIKTMLITQKHLIIAYAKSRLEWVFKYIPSNIHDESLKPFKLDKRYQHPEKNEIASLVYNQAYTKLMVGIADASVIVLPVPAETFQDQEEQEVQEEEKNIDLEIDFVKLGSYQKGVITVIREFKYNVIVTGSQSGKVVFWDIVTRSPLTYFYQQGSITSGDLKDQTLILGSSEGVVRFYNVGDIRNPVLYKITKLFLNRRVDYIVYNGDQIAISSNDSQNIFFFYLENLIGYVELPFNCQSIAWHKNTLICLSQFLLLSIQAPTQNQSTLKLDVPIYGRKVDPDQLLLCIAGSEVITTGKDKIVKRYKLPEEVLSKMDLKMKIANQGPLEEQDGHQLAITCLHAKESTLYSGAKDGTIMMRSAAQLTQDVRMIKAHNIKHGGVSAIYVSNKFKLVYTAGYQGDFTWWTGEKIKADSDSHNLMKNNFSAPPEQQDQADSEVMYYQQLLEKEYLLAQAPIREQQKQQTKEQIKSIQSKLYQLLEENQTAEELERLDRDQFVIDIVARDMLLEDGKKQQSVLREQIRKENLKYEILYNLIKERTWDQMEVPLKGINGLVSNILVWNYHIRVRTAEEIRKFKLIRELRKQELKELKLRKTLNQKEVWSIEEQTPENKYIINSKPGQQQLIIMDYEKKEDPAPVKVVANVKGQPATKAPQNARQLKARQQQEEQQKKEEEEEKAKQKALLEQQAAQQQKQSEQKQGNADEMTEWDYIYGVSELFSTNRKRNQMILLGDVILNIKRQYNSEFELMMKQRSQQMDNINERNKRIQEINAELKKESQLIVINPNKFENPEKILQVTPQEIPFVQYQTREMREKLEQERLKEEARLKALMSDDAGIRAVKDMMNGTLEEKKDTPLDEKLEMEDWMSKNPDDMNEDERMKFKEFEVKKARLEEEKEKIRKNLEAELKKLNTEIADICQRYDEKLLILFRRKLEYDYRVLEQELCIVRLALSIITQQQASIKVKELQDLHDTMSKRFDALIALKEQLDLLKTSAQNEKQKTQESINNYFVNEGRQYKIIPQLDGKLKIIWQSAFEDKKDAKAQKEYDEQLLQDPNYKSILIPIDPLFELRKKEIVQILDDRFETHLKDIQDKAITFQGVDYDHVKDSILTVLQQRFNLNKEFQKQIQESQELEQFSKQFEGELTNLEQSIQASEEDQLGIRALIEKNKSNIEMLIRFKQGYVEVSQDKPVPNLSEAVLMPREALDLKNKEIKAQGDKKIAFMEEIKKIKFDVAKSEYELKRRELIIRDLECKTREVQLLKVKKEMQIALTKNDTCLNDKELKNIEKQIEILRKATEKRLTILQKKREKIEKDIDFIRKENQQLLGQGANLKANVDQLKDISEMQNKKAGKQGEDAEVVEDKFTQIALNHKYFHIAKKHAEEIELLREELAKLKSKTFANFANAQR